MSDPASPVPASEDEPMFDAAARGMGFANWEALRASDRTPEVMAAVALYEALEDIDAYLDDTPAKCDTWSIGDAGTPFVGSLRILRAEVSRLRSQVERMTGEIEARGEIYGRMCETLHECCQRHGLGLGGEHVDRLVVEEVDRLREDVLTPLEARGVMADIDRDRRRSPEMAEWCSKHPREVQAAWDAGVAKLRRRLSSDNSE